MKGKTVKESNVIVSYITQPQDANRVGNVHGGVVMKQIDSAAALVATRHARSNCVTASVDRLDFFHPVFIGNLLILKASLNMVGRTSMEVGVRAEAEDPLTGEVHHTASAYLTFVALDEDGRPKGVPSLILETADDKRRNREALLRKDIRFSENKRLKNG